MNEDQRLQDVQERIAKLTAELRRAEGERDAILRKQLDNDGAHDRRPVGVR